jgi:hypothetical protein
MRSEIMLAMMKVLNYSLIFSKLIFHVNYLKEGELLPYLHLRKHLLYTFMDYTITAGNYQSFFWVYNFLNKFQCGLPWWHGKYPDNIRPCFMLLEAYLVSPYPQCPLCRLSGFEGRWPIPCRQCSSHNPRRKNSVGLNLVTSEAKQLVHLCPSSSTHLSVQVILNMAEMWGCPILLEDSLRW